jgi:hypothetical protein
MKRIINEYDKMPKWYGLTYWQHATGQGVCYPIILNVVVRICITIWRRLKYGLIPSWYEKRIEEIRQDAWWTGYNYGVRVKTSLTEEFLRKMGIL